MVDAKQMANHMYGLYKMYNVCVSLVLSKQSSWSSSKHKIILSIINNAVAIVF